MAGDDSVEVWVKSSSDCFGLIELLTALDALNIGIWFNTKSKGSHRNGHTWNRIRLPRSYLYLLQKLALRCNEQANLRPIRPYRWGKSRACVCSSWTLGSFLYLRIPYLCSPSFGRLLHCLRGRWHRASE